MSFPTPFDRYRGKVLPEWIDLNDHMNVAYYTVLFDFATDVIYDEFGLGPLGDYKGRSNHGTMAAEAHNIFKQELLVDEAVGVISQIIGVDYKRLHMAHTMYRLSDGTHAAMQELMYLHVDLGARKVVPWPHTIMTKLEAAAAAHAAVAKPDWVGRRIAIPPR